MQHMLTSASSTPSTHGHLKARGVGFPGNLKCPLLKINSLSQRDRAPSKEEKDREDSGEGKMRRRSSKELPGFPFREHLPKSYLSPTFPSPP